jgi:hypothetical protein
MVVMKKRITDVPLRCKSGLWEQRHLFGVPHLYGLLRHTPQANYYPVLHNRISGKGAFLSISNPVETSQLWLITLTIKRITGFVRAC